MQVSDDEKMRIILTQISENRYDIEEEILEEDLFNILNSKN